MDIETKILSLDELQRQVAALKRQGKKIVHCHGHFNVLHPGHYRFFQFVRKQGDFVVVSVVGSDLLPEHNQREYFDQHDRAVGIASLNMVDAVYKLPGSILELIDAIKPDIHVKGREFEALEFSFGDELEAIRRTGGKLIYSSGSVRYYNQKNIEIDEDDGGEDNKARFLRVCHKHKIGLQNLIDRVGPLSDLKLLVIGDTIVDQYVACDALGVSSEAPVLAIRELRSKQFLGGAGIVAQHIKSMGAQSYYISVTGNDEPGAFAARKLEDGGVHATLFIDEGRPTTFKIRYMVDNQKLLRVSRLEQHNISAVLSKKVVQQIADTIPLVDGVIVSDFVYGVITDEILSSIVTIAKESGKPIFGDLQCSSQYGDVSKFKNFDLITPTEKEARIAMKDTTSGLERIANSLLDRTLNRGVVITLGGEGLLAYNRGIDKSIVTSEYFPALEDSPVDVAGAGDALLVGYAIGLCKGLSLLEASAFASCMAGVSVTRMGNVPITFKEVKEYVTRINSTNSEYM